nr:Lrp/AsnC family transcriptional regulator [uncultured Blautia sp.]
MYLSGLDETDQKILELLTQNARQTYSEIGEKLGISRVAVKNHIDAMEQNGIIEEYTVIINPQKLGGAVSCYFEIETAPQRFQEVIKILSECPTITQIYRTTGACRLHVHAVAADQAEMEKFMQECIDSLPGIVHISTNVILSRIKDVKGLRL